MKVIIAGNRYFNDWEFFKSIVDKILKNVTDIEIVSGECIFGKKTFVRSDGIGVCGADGMGERYANLKGYPVKHFPAKWDEQGKSAGPKRNKEMAEYADALIAFWNGKSTGTKNMIDISTKLGLKIRVIKF